MKKSTWVTPVFKPTLFGIILVGLILATFPFASQAAPLKQPSWHAEYYDNAGLSGQPKISRFEAAFGQDWGLGSPALEIPNDRFSARWTSTKHLEKGTYLFLLTVDDGARVWLDGKLIMDAWDLGRKEKLKTKLRIDKTGDHELQIAYFENTGYAGINLEWIQLGGEDDIVGAWNGEYFNNKDLAGSPIVTRQDGAISYDWSLGSPHAKIPRDNFSVRWTRSVYLKAGLYKFRIQHDDGMRVFVDDKIIYDSWFDQSVTYQTRQFSIKEGYRTFRVEYYDHVGSAVAQLSFEIDPERYDNADPGSDGPALVVDNNSAGFWWDDPDGNKKLYVNRGGFGDDFYWTYNTNNATPNFGRWTPSIKSAGNYEVFAFIPGSRATTTSAHYKIQHFGRLAERIINQSAYNNEFVSLGTYHFGAAGEEFVALYSNTGESAGSASVAYDAVKFVKR